MKTKTFDCVEMKRQAAARIQETIGKMTLEEKVAYWRGRNEAFLREQRELRSGAPASEQDEQTSPG